MLSFFRIEKFHQEKSWARELLKEDLSFLNQINDLIFPYNFYSLQSEIKKLKIQDLVFQIQNRGNELEKLTSATNSKLSKTEKYPLEKLLKRRNKILKTKNPNPKKLVELKEILNEKLTPEELQVLLDKQAELHQLEKHLESLQQNQELRNQIQTEKPPK